MHQLRLEAVMFKLPATVLTVAMACAPAIAAAQGISEVALKGGVSVANLPEAGDSFEQDGATTSDRVGVIIGGHVAFRVNDVLAIQPEMFFVQKGLTGEDPSNQGEFSYNVDYISVPILARFSLTGANGLQLLAGPSFNFVARARLKADALVFEQGSVDRDIKSEVEDVDFGFVAAVGYYGSLLLVEARFEEGFSNVPTFLDDSQSYRNRAYMVMAGIRFR